ncbi:ATP-binding protein [Streptomyces sp. 1222.5]|uniref:ATP-binding protein n=1 Tax=Streptomyces sp. 1222.5 TaxID=1881026 RepID=UPI003EBEF7B7
MATVSTEGTGIRHLELWLDGARGAVTEARLATQNFAAAVGCSGETENDLSLVVSELVTNACRHAPGPCRMRLEADDESVTVEVWDSVSCLPNFPTASCTEPDICDHTSLRCGGYGLQIVASLCRELKGLLGDDGKTVRAILAY